MNTNKNMNESINPKSCTAVAIVNKNGDIVDLALSYEAAVLKYGGFPNIQTHDLVIVTGTWTANSKV